MEAGVVLIVFAIIAGVISVAFGTSAVANSFGPDAVVSAIVAVIAVFLVVVGVNTLNTLPNHNSSSSAIYQSLKDVGYNVYPAQIQDNGHTLVYKTESGCKFPLILHDFEGKIRPAVEKDTSTDNGLKLLRPSDLATLDFTCQ